MKTIVFVWSGALVFVALIGPIMTDPVFLASVAVGAVTSLIVNLATYR